MAYKKAKVFAHLDSLQTPVVIITASEFHDSKTVGRELLKKLHDANATTLSLE